jgi:hypothetical protein
VTRVLLKRAVFSIATGVAILCFVEALAIGAHYATGGALFTWHRVVRALLDASGAENPDRVLAPDEIPVKARNEALHPFYGFVTDPARARSERNVSGWGFPQAAGDQLFRSKKEGLLRVAFFGGSVALGVSVHARMELAKCLRRLDSEVDILNFAAPGYKQPQQLHVLADMYARGAHFDAVINLDGYNELVLSVIENARSGIHPSFPRRWRERVARSLAPEKAREIGALVVLQERRANAASALHRSQLYRSPTISLFWQQWDHWIDTAIFEQRQRVMDTNGEASEGSFEGSGPAFSTADEDVLQLVTQMWRRASTQMHLLSEANGGRYFHFLQPNQYVEGSKPMSDEERAVAFRRLYPYREPIVRGYPKLLSAGEKLRAGGVRFHDLTLMFQDKPQPLYADTCCHLNREGYFLVVAEICEVLQDSFGPS